MPIIACPHCSRRVSIPDHVVEKKVRCARCRKTFVAEEAVVAEIDDDEDATEPRRRRGRKGFRCIHCGSREEPDVSERTSVAGWVTFGVLLLVTLPGIILSGNVILVGPAILVCCVALFIKEDYRTCADCGIRLG
jgi:DNA-directed RNA polymerase subunit RPC12/RpoP